MATNQMQGTMNLQWLIVIWVFRLSTMQCFLSNAIQANVYDAVVIQRMGNANAILHKNLPGSKI